MCDASVQFVTSDIELGLWQAMGTMNGSEVGDNTAAPTTPSR
jgi:hypothetical protein